jgi:hypothetical protein
MSTASPCKKKVCIKANCESPKIEGSFFCEWHAEKVRQTQLTRSKWGKHWAQQALKKKRQLQQKRELSNPKIVLSKPIPDDLTITKESLLKRFHSLPEPEGIADHFVPGVRR